ncbi:MAG TPA: cysteine peptidase family C39 domain-containing protein, partial [Pirellulales bacterium]
EVAKHQYGLNVLGVVSTAENLRRRSPPFACIAHLRNNHFVNIADITDDTATIIDPPRQFEMPVDALAASWDGHALLLSTSPLAREEDLTRPVSHFAWPLGLVGFAVFVALLGWRRLFHQHNPS